MSGIVYLLCAATSFLCCGLLWRGYRRSSVRLLLWSSLCFAGFALDNVLLYVDAEIIPDVDISAIRRLPALIGLMLLLFGLVWDSK
jgi:hypothetical protein